jgi:hypothetical protein
MKLIEFSDLWIHLAANLADGLCAGQVSKSLNPEDK